MASLARRPLRREASEPRRTEWQTRRSRASVIKSEQERSDKTFPAKQEPWSGAGTGRQAGLKNPWYESTVRVRLPLRPHVGE